MITIDLMFIFKLFCLIMLLVEGLLFISVAVKEQKYRKESLIGLLIFIILPFVYIFIKE